MDEQMWSQLRPKDLYVLNKSTRTMVLKTKAPPCSMPRKPCTIQFLIDRISKLFNANKDHIHQIREERAEQERLQQEALEQEALELSPESTHEVSPSWDHEPLSTSLISNVQIVDTGGEVVLYHDEEPAQDEEEEEEPVEED